MTENNIRLIDLTKTDLANLISEAVSLELKKVISLMNLQPEKEENRIISRSETSKLLGVSLTTLFHWNKQNILVAKKIGSKVYYLKNDVMDKLKSVA
ncbi:AlpA family transcriptional regulator [Flavobacterium sp. 140616W15]|uniref:helix-turn-helix transcriptional regulator n=1 Tax=Flavobacterium sp. 140616W15 TaxID=2478552 RepID=UPI000F0C16F3|nr:DNA-binding protein [Flavobacterium sp. 140616W15]AYN05488.1 DNA-binding protein [Flavobacterium sp. 140616W15]